MARRKLTQNFSPDLFAQISRSLGAASAQQAAQMYAREASGLIRPIEEHLETSTKKIRKSIAQNVRQPLNDFFVSTDKQSQRAGDTVSKNFTNPMHAAFDGLTAHAIKANKQIADEMSNAFKNFKPPASSSQQKPGWLDNIKNSYKPETLAPALKGVNPRVRNFAQTAWG